MSSPRRILVGRPTGPRRQAPPPALGAPLSGTAGHDAGLVASRRSAAERAEQVAAARGYADGLARGRAEVDAALDAVGVLAAELERLAPRDAARAATAITRLALVVAEQVLGRAVAIDPGLLVEIIERAASAINGSPTARVILSPTVRPIVEDAWIARHGTAYLGKRWVFEADPSLPPGGCRLVYEHGFVDASIEAQIEEIERAIEHALPTILNEVGGLDGLAAGLDPRGPSAGKAAATAALQATGPTLVAGTADDPGGQR